MSNEPSEKIHFTSSTSTFKEAFEGLINQLASNLHTRVPQIAELAEAHRVDLQRIRTSLNNQFIAHTVAQTDAEALFRTIAGELAQIEQERVAELSTYARALVTVMEIELLELVRAHVASADR